MSARGGGGDNVSCLVSHGQNHCVLKSCSCFTRRLRAVSAARLPHVVLLSVFEYLSLKDLAHCMLVCKHWWTVLQYPDSSVWKRLAHLIIPAEALCDSCLLSETPSFKEKLRAFCYAWNPNDSSKNNYLRSNGFTVHRNPVAQSTDSVRGKIGVNSGIHAWEFVWEGPLGTVACIGLATKYAALHCQGYVALLGSDDQSWGWNLVDNQLLHNSTALCSYPHINNPPKYQVNVIMGERIRMVVDCEQHSVYFEKGNEFLGIAFSRLPPLKLFPAICAVYGLLKHHSELNGITLLIEQKLKNTRPEARIAFHSHRIKAVEKFLLEVPV